LSANSPGNNRFLHRFLTLCLLFVGLFSAKADAGVFPGDSTITATICANETYLFDGQSLNTSGEYVATYQASDGSDSTVFLQLTVLPLGTSSITDTICANEVYPFFGLDLNESGEYEGVVNGDNGCDSIVVLKLTVLPVQEVTITDTICNGDSYAFFGALLTTSGTYDVVLAAENGCDSIILLQLTVLPTPITNLQAGICTGTGFVFQNDTLTVGGSYQAILTAENGCDSIVNLKLDVVDFFNTALEAVICNDETFAFGGLILDTSGEYVDSLQAIGGCDSIVTLVLTVLPPSGNTIDVTICEGASYVFYGDTLTAAGDYLYPLTDQNGCDSLVRLNLSTTTFFETALAATICAGETYVFGSQELTDAGIYSETITASGGCDSILVLTLEVLPTSATAFEATICEGEGYEYQGEVLANAGDYTFVLEGANGCDSVVTLTLNVLEVPNTVIEAVICSGASFFFYGDELTVEGVYEAVFDAENGCDSIVSLILTVLPPLETDVTFIICPGTTFDFNGQILDSAGVYSQVLTSELGCDSTVNLTLVVLPSLDTSIVATICAGEFYEFYGDTLTESGTYSANFFDVFSCEYTATLSLTVLPVKATNLVATVCEGTEYPFNGAILTASGEYTAIFEGEFGCDSTVTLQLTVLPVSTTTIDTTICEGSSLNYYGQQLSDAGSYEFSFTGANGCDSLVVINLSVTPLTYGSTEVAICAGESYDYNGESITETGVYNFTFPGANGCDSIFIVYLSVFPTYDVNVEASACEGTSYDFYGTAIVASGTYVQEFTSVSGCDSTITLNITFVESFASSFDASICAGESYVFENDTLTDSGTYTQAYTTVGGCDSLVTLNLTVLPLSQSTTVAAICAGSTYTFNGAQYSDAGNYSALLTGANGCDSVAILQLSILPNATGSQSATICAGAAFAFQGTILTTTGVYTAVVPAANGCDSTITLTLEVLPAITGTAAATICSGDVFNFNGDALTVAGTYTAVYTAVNGCDSTVTLTLTVTPAAQSVFASVVCNGASFEFNGETLTESGTYTFQLEGAAASGCDSVITLFLTIFPAIPPTDIQENICTGESYLFDGQTLTQSGTYTANLGSSTGCDSVVVLTLQVVPASATAISDKICVGGSYEFNGEVLIDAGLYTAILTNAAGCDSVVTLSLELSLISVAVTLDNGTLSAASAGATFQWINCADNQPITGETNASFTPSASGNYAVVVTNGDGCTTTSACIPVVVSAVSSLLADNGWAIQPNPAQHQTVVVLHQSLQSDVALEVFDAAGRLLGQQHIATGTTRIPLELGQFPDGMLLIRLVGTEGVSTKWLVKGN
jgi:hypothetical protein